MTLARDFPSGWFFVGLAADLAPCGVRRVDLADRSLVVFRTEQGSLGALDAHCPHLGAPLARGVVDAESLRCPLHGMKWTTTGAPRGAAATCSLRARAYPTLERHGLAFVWYDSADAAPTFDIPALDASRWTPLRMRTDEHDVPPVVVLEAHAADLGHNVVLHREEDLATIEPLRVSRDAVHAAIRMRHPSPTWARGLMRVLTGDADGIATEVRSSTHGIGYQYVRSYVPALGVLGHQFMLPVPLATGRTRVHVVFAIEGFGGRSDVHSVLRALPAAPVDRVLGAASYRALMEAIDEHATMWVDQKMVDEPEFQPGEDSLARFRAWARSFYPANRPMA